MVLHRWFHAQCLCSNRFTKRNNNLHKVWQSIVVQIERNVKNWKISIDVLKVLAIFECWKIFQLYLHYWKRWFVFSFLKYFEKIILQVFLQKNFCRQTLWIFLILSSHKNFLMEKYLSYNLINDQLMSTELYF